MKYLCRLPMMALLLLMGCESNNDNTSNIQDELNTLLENDEMIAFVGLEDDGIQDMNYTSGIEEDGGMEKILADTLWPDSDDYRIRFGRSIDSLSRDIEWDIDEDNGIAFANITRTLNGVLHIIAIDSNGTIVDTFNKSFESTFSQSIRFIQNDNENGRPWFIDAFTIGHGSTGDKVSIDGISIFRGDTLSPAFHYTADDINSLYIPRDSIPAFNFRFPVRAEVSISNTGPEFPFRSGEAVLLHYGRGRHEKGRKRLNDMGLWPDGTANDNKFSGLWRIHGPGHGHQRRVFMAWFDVIDFSTMFVSDEAVHSELWRIPYQSVRP